MVLGLWCKISGVDVVRMLGMIVGSGGLFRVRPRMLGILVSQRSLC